MLPEQDDVENWIATLSVDELERLHKMILFEPGTRVYRKQRFNELLESEINRSRRNSRCLSLALLKVANFDEIAHSDGASVISTRMRQVAVTLKRYLRDADLPVRYGADSFAIIMPEATVSGAHRGLLRICSKVMEEQPPAPIAKPLVLSFGIATFPVDGRDGKEVEHRAKQSFEAFVPSPAQLRADQSRQQILTDIAWHLIGGTANWDTHCAELMKEHAITTDEVRKACIKMMD